METQSAPPANISRHIAAPVRARSVDKAMEPPGLDEHPDGEACHRDQDDRPGEGLILADHVHSVLDDEAWTIHRRGK